MSEEKIGKGFNKYASAINMALLVAIALGVYTQSSENKLVLAERGVWMSKKDESDLRRDKEIKLLELELDNRTKSRFTKEDGEELKREIVSMKDRLRKLEESIWRLRPVTNE